VAVRVGQNLAVQDAVPGQIASGLHQFRKLLADVVEVAAVQADLRTTAVELGSNAVVLVLDPNRRPQARDDLGRVLDRRGQHELDRVQETEAGRVQAVLLGENGRLADVTGEHPRQLDRGLRSLEGLGDSRLEQPLAQPDAQLSGEYLDHVLGGQRIA